MLPLLLALYLSVPGLATPAAADLTAARALAAEAVPKLTFRDDPTPPPVTAFALFEGGTADLSDYAGAVVVLNFWATWCAPCRKEMPSLQTLQDEMGGADLQVVTMAFGRHHPQAMERFWEDTGVDTLPLHRDPQGEMAAALGVKGLPHTLILDRAGTVVAELIGDADWAADPMQAVLAAIAE
ncbi:TlpA disulfide reductase family protein [Jannaschia sp. LMIT008]|uniref:TlpA family protein disulfide reductase n=1 Tax=Jannaschia maritima TaxID=3032585 RepID=UPI0028113EBC|nr:TlpA disulfide reductase family protein [Jannaschia sp. LMIT008]